MSDIRIVSHADLSETVADWLLLSNGTLDESEELANYAKVALMTDALAATTEVLPDPQSSDRRGWWGDMDAQTIWRGWPIGCKNWLLERAKISDLNSFEGDTVVRAEDYTRTALQPMIDLQMCSAIDVHAWRAGPAIDRIYVRVIIYRGPDVEVDLIFQDLWQDMVVVPIRGQFGYAPASQNLLYQPG
jgi:phage gp46-like protein